MNPESAQPWNGLERASLGRKPPFSFSIYWAKLSLNPKKAFTFSTKNAFKYTMQIVNLRCARCGCA